LQQPLQKEERMLGERWRRRRREFTWKKRLRKDEGAASKTKCQV